MNITYTVTLDDEVTDDDGNLIDDFEKLTIVLPNVLSYLADTFGMIDYGSLLIEAERDAVGFVVLNISVNILNL